MLQFVTFVDLFNETIQINQTLLLSCGVSFPDNSFFMISFTLFCVQFLSGFLTPGTLVSSNSDWIQDCAADKESAICSEENAKGVKIKS